LVQIEKPINQQSWGGVIIISPTTLKPYTTVRSLGDRAGQRISQGVEGQVGQKLYQTPFLELLGIISRLTSVTLLYDYELYKNANLVKKHPET